MHHAQPVRLNTTRHVCLRSTALYDQFFEFQLHLLARTRTPRTVFRLLPVLLRFLLVSRHCFLVYGTLPAEYSLNSTRPFSA